MHILAIGVAGLAGVYCRYFVLSLLGPFKPGVFPWSTFVVNLIGSFLIGLVLAFELDRSWITAQDRVILATGFLGGFTTFSAFSSESMGLLTTGHGILAMIYVFSSVVGGIVLAFLGYQAGRI